MYGSSIDMDGRRWRAFREKIGAKTEGGNDPTLHRSEGHSTYKGFMLAA